MSERAPALLIRERDAAMRLGIDDDPARATRKLRCLRKGQKIACVRIGRRYYFSTFHVEHCYAHATQARLAQR